MNVFTCILLISYGHFGGKGVSRLQAAILDLLVSASVPNHCDKDFLSSTVFQGKRQPQTAHYGHTT